ncbi:MAG: ABC transporter permease, partial [Acidobacteriota bacterium]|nr:ABC transporter permease [Acidobacteriota bacterium]
VESESALVGDAVADAAGAAAEKSSMRRMAILSYLANSIRSGEREIPYSLVTSLDQESFADLQAASSIDENKNLASDAESSTLSPIILNRWAVDELRAKIGDPVALDYYLWAEDGRLLTRTEQFRLAGTVDIKGAAADRDLVPEYPGLTESANLSDWDPPFPVDLSRISARDEEYWDQYRTTPKAFIALAKGQELWQSRFGKLTSLRITAPEVSPQTDALEAYRSALRSSLDPERGGMMVLPVRTEGLEASRGATDFGEYFLYFSFFLVVSALLLTALFFRLGIEQRLTEIGVLQSLGFSAARLRLMFLSEAAVLTVAGSTLGMLGAYLYGRLMMLGLSTWWAGAVGTTTLSLHAAPSSFLFGAAGGIMAALVCIVWTLRSVSRRSARSLLSGSTIVEQSSNIQSPRSRHIKPFARIASFFSAGRASVIFSVLGLMLLLAASVDRVGQVAGFFGGGALLLIALLCAQSWWLRRRRVGSSIGAGGWPSVFHLGIRNATHRPGRSVLCVTLIATASFMIVAVDAFRRGDQESTLNRKSGAGGYSLLAESQLPVVYDPGTPEGRDALSLVNMGQGSDSLDGVSFARFRVKPGDDTSCLNLYRPRNPKMIAPTDDFLRSGRFTFQDSLAETAEEKEHPWMLLRREFADGAVPVIADANSAAYVLHLKVGEDFTLERERGENAPRLRLVGTLADSVFQGELVMSENNFRQLFPEQAGYRLFLLDVPTAERERGIASVLEERLADFGFDVTPTAERLASFHRVENTYLSTFQMLGGLGLMLGTIGLAVVLLRNVLERRRELALLRAVGYHKFHFALMVIAENALLLFCGLVTGTVCALLAIAPVLLERGGRAPLLSLGVLLAAVIASGLVASLLATAAALRSPLITELRAE